MLKMVTVHHNLEASVSGMNVYLKVGIFMLRAINHTPFSKGGIYRCQCDYEKSEFANEAVEMAEVTYGILFGYQEVID